MKLSKKILALFLLLLTMISFLTCIPTGAEDGVHFGIDEIEVQSGRLFEASIKVGNASTLAAFSAEVEYDPSVLQYRSAKSEAGELSVNTSETGKLRVVFLMEEGVGTDSGTGVLSLEFKALSAGDSRFKLCVDEAIDTEGRDLTFTACSEGIVHISKESASSDKSGKGDAFEDKAFVEASESVIVAENHRDLFIGDSRISTDTIISVSLLVLFTVGILMWVSYKLGVKKQKEKTSVPLEKSREISGGIYIKGEIKDEENS